MNDRGTAIPVQWHRDPFASTSARKNISAVEITGEVARSHVRTSLLREVANVSCLTSLT
jgi:hypothetical protein